jgi:Fe-S cluster biogenesis protein NfuA
MSTSAGTAAAGTTAGRAVAGTAAAPQNLRATGDRIEQLFDELEASGDPVSRRLAEELLRSVTDLYAAGLARVVDLATARDPELVTAFVADELVASLLVAHGLHPEAVEHRVEGALASVRPLLAAHGGDVELLAVDGDRGTVRLRLLGSCDGCPSSAVTLQSAVERSIEEAAPEIVRIEVDQPSRAVAVPVVMGAKPAYESCPTEMVPT